MSNKLHVFIFGSDLPTKKTLAEVISILQTNIMVLPEVAYTVLLDLGIPREHLRKTEHRIKFQEQILVRQHAMEKAQTCNHYISIHGIETLVLSAIYVSEEFYQYLLTTTYAKECIETYKKSLVFMVKPQTEVGNRDISYTDKLIMERTIKMLEEHKIPFELVDQTDIIVSFFFLKRLIK